MKNIMFAAIIISVTALSANSAFSTGNESKKGKKACAKSTKEILKFSVSDFTGTEDAEEQVKIAPELPKKIVPAKNISETKPSEKIRE